MHKEVVHTDVRDPRISRLCSWENPVGEAFLFAYLQKSITEINSSRKLDLGRRKRLSQRSPRRRSRSGFPNHNYNKYGGYRKQQQRTFNAGNKKSGGGRFLGKRSKPAKKDS